MKYLIAIIILVTLNFKSMAQNKNDLPYYEVPADYDEYTAGTVTARMIDGLGFRYRWATENLREEDLKYKASESGRTIMETMQHILDLSWIVVNSALEKSNDFSIEKPKLGFDDMRKQTLENIQKASHILQKEKDLARFDLRFISEKGERKYPFWNQINGPIEDAVWHAGQIVVLRRAAGNPLNSKVSFLTGTVRE